MRIAVLGTRGFPDVQGGVETHCYHLYPRLVELGCDVTVFTRKQYVQENIKEFKGVKLHALYTVKNKYLETPLHTLIGIFHSRRIKPDIVHFQAVGSALFIPLARVLGQKVVLTTHGSNYRHKKWGFVGRAVLKLSEYLGVKFANEIIAISATTARELEEKYGRGSTVIPNGIAVETPLQTEKVLKQFGLVRNKYIISVGRLIPDKGFPNLISAFLEANLDGWKLAIVGQPDHPDKFSRQLKQQVGQHKNIVLTGFLSGQPLNEIYAHAGLFVSASYYEGMPLALLEALSFGISCIVSDIPAHQEIKLDRNRYFPPGDIGSLAEKIKSFSEMPLSEGEKQAQVMRVADRFNWDRVAAETMKIYEKVIR